MMRSRRNFIKLGISAALAVSTGAVAVIAAKPATTFGASDPFDGDSMILALEALGFRFEVDREGKGFVEWFPQCPMSAEQEQAYQVWWKACHADVNGSKKCVAFLQRRAMAAQS